MVAGKGHRFIIEEANSESETEKEGEREQDRWANGCGSGGKESVRGRIMRKETWRLGEILDIRKRTAGHTRTTAE